jgi:hypothetical protein
MTFGGETVDTIQPYLGEHVTAAAELASAGGMIRRDSP